MKEIGDCSQQLKDWFMQAVDLDTDAFNAVLAARRLPNTTDEQRRARDAAVEAANHEATRVPLRVLERAVETLDLALRTARDGLPASASDAGVAGACALACAEGAALNVRINLPSIGDGAVAGEIDATQRRLLETARKLAGEVRDVVEAVLAAG
jgi:glutamate formiminotransferase/formiminotetrahydrofolate cyclodeaminase